MTDRHTAYVVVLDRDIREDDAEATIRALHQIKGVLTVEPVMPDIATFAVAARRDRAWREALMNMFQSGPEES